MCGSDGGITIREPRCRGSTGLLILKLEVKEQDDDEVAALLRQQRLIASSDNPEGRP
jgi:hypothetical protein